ncbi:MAG: Kelch repeat-containing protein [Steroidobacteraceae bacterium]
MTESKRPHCARVGAALLLTTLCACSGGQSSAPPATYTIGGAVTGLSGSGLVLQDNAGAGLAVSAPGAFTFTGGLSTGSAYSVTVAAQPTGQQCEVTHGSGTVGTANVTDVVVACISLRFTALANQPPEPGYLALLLTDGSVMMQSINDAGVFYDLVPAADGGYVNGTWRVLASPPAGYAPYAGSQAVLADGRVLFVGGEYNQNEYSLPFAPSGLTNMSAIYDPVADRWTMIAPPPGVAFIGDSPSAVLPDGSFIFGAKLGRDMWRLDPVSLSWTSVPAAGKADDFAEEGWTLLPDGELFTIDVGDPPHAEHYDPAAGQWYGDGSTPTALTSPSDTPGGITYGPAPVQVVGGVSYGPGPAGVYFPPGEIGPALLLPDGRVFAAGAATSGSTAHTALYIPGTTPADPGSFTAGPDFAAGDDAADASAALLPSGHVLIAAMSGQFYEYDGTAMPVTAVLPNNGGTTFYFVLPLPNGQALVTGGVTQIYSGAGSANPAWAPAITAAPASVTRGTTYSISGTQFNGLSQAAEVGDELNAATNYPLVRITNTASGHVVYARTHGHSSMGVATGSTIVSTSFDVPSVTEAGASSLAVVANGIASAPVGVMVN